MSIKQVFIPYEKWEDWLNGMWHNVSMSEEKILLQKAIVFTGNHLLFGAAMQEVVYEWHQTMTNSLTNPSINARAFLGQCACCYRLQCPEYITRMAWKELTDEQRYKANDIAQTIIDSWKIVYQNNKQFSFDFRDQ